ncbi:hypothetical protein DDZ18_07040 [Marinicauda salina]|uniref:Methyltransferase domain-containing protein n=1 Tax=Marinicauda salina TaxID=2135793 RepID=A0A2U2BTU0_9PROT|nr:class I SAM-dependent methyltransferase [Marinicauda salina]PWE17428.1 hypothetical protein DDZ18_07040 [Marinicauda salina]
MRMQAWNWAVSLRSTGTCCRVFMHHTPGALSRNQRRLFKDLGISLIEAKPIGKGPARYCNKIRQLSTPELLDTDFVILSDADILFLTDPAEWALPNCFRAKPVDLPNPPETAWRKLFKETALIDRISEQPLEIAPGSSTFSTNFNGGLYIIPTSMTEYLSNSWERYALMCLSREDVLGSALHHSDQIAMGMALAEHRVDIRPLPTGANLPTHLGAEHLARIPRQTVSGLHYHGHVDNHGRPLTTGVDWIDHAITESRQILDKGRRSAFSNSIFWDFRYARFPKLGSGLGSRNEPLSYKRELLARYFDSRPQGKVLDVGCGDIEATRNLQIADYTGIDTSAEAIAIAQKKRPDWSFYQESTNTYPNLFFDYTLCLDVFIHQPKKEDSIKLANEICRITRREILFTSHTISQDRSGISFDSYDVPQFFSQIIEINNVTKIGTYRDVDVFIAKKFYF